MEWVAIVMRLPRATSVIVMFIENWTVSINVKPTKIA
jgi:hypothetical protein